MTEEMQKPTAAIYTLGCKVNQYESEAIKEALKQKGFEIVPFEETADVYIINTCTVTAESDRKACQVIRRAAGRTPQPYVIVTGCMAQSQPERAAALEGVSYVCGSRNKMSCADMAASYAENRNLPKEAEIAVFSIDDHQMEEMQISHSEGDRTRAYVKVEDGCENRCTYCAIPGSRGWVTSKHPDAAIREMRTLAANGYRELVVTGIEIASYGVDFKADPAYAGYRLIDLLEEADQIPGIDRIRLGSLEPTYMKPETVSRMAKLEHLAPHFHLSLQSGADHVLRLMKRKYQMQRIRELMADIRAKMPDVQFTTDIMTGFPQETPEDFEETLAFAKEARFLHIHVFPYSRRKDTEADLMPGQLPNAEKNRRAAILSSEQKQIETEIYRKAALGAPTVTILPEAWRNGMVIGHTANFMEVHLFTERPLPHILMQAEVIGSEEAALLAKLV